MVKAVRGAISVEKNNKDSITTAVEELFNELIAKNDLLNLNIVSIVFSVTKDLTACNPATALRKFGFNSTPLFCAAEPYVKGGLKKIIRVLITFNCDESFVATPVYLKNATKLRPDLSSK